MRYFQYILKPINPTDYENSGKPFATGYLFESDEQLRKEYGAEHFQILTRQLLVDQGAEYVGEQITKTPEAEEKISFSDFKQTTKTIDREKPNYDYEAKATSDSSLRSEIEVLKAQVNTIHRQLEIRTEQNKELRSKNTQLDEQITRVTDQRDAYLNRLYEIKDELSKLNTKVNLRVDY